MQMHTGTQRTALQVVAGVIAGLVGGFVLGSAVGSPASPDSQPENDAPAMMCTALDDLDAAFLERMANEEMSFRTTEDARMTASLKAAVGYAEVAAQAGEGDDELFATANDLRTAMARIQGDVAREHVDALREYC